MKFIRPFLVAFVAVAAVRSSATTFIVPDDAELVRKSEGIVTGVVIAANAAEVEPGYVETFYEVALDRVLKGPFEPRTNLRIHSPGGITPSRFTVVESSAHFRIGEQVLIFLTPHRGGWTTTDLTLGKFRFAVTSSGHSVVVRDEEDIVGWDRDGKVHKEKIRRDTEFLDFIKETVAGRTPDKRGYEVEAGDVLAAPLSNARTGPPVAELFPAPAHTYAVSFYDCSLNRTPGRWTTSEMNAGIPFFKNSAQNASGLGDGGVSIIQTALASWTNDCGSNVNITYGGTSANLKNPADEVNVIVFNDPGNHIAGSFGTSGTIAVTFSVGDTTHLFDGTDFVSFTDSDIVFQNGYAGTQTTIEEAMTHELGHAIGFRHADKHYIQNCTAPGCVPTCSETACQPSVEDCASTAIMTAAVNPTLNYTLQTWDKNAADALYPGACIVVNPPPTVVATATSTSSVNITWTASAGAASYNIYRSPDALNYTLAGNTASTSFADGGRPANTAYLYKVRAVSGTESGDSNVDLATTTIFTDDPLVATTTLVKAAHITELRTAVNAVRTLASLGAGTYSDPTLTVGVTTIKAAHINDLRTALDQARAALALPALTYGETVTIGLAVKAAHVTELRNGVK